MFIALSSEGLVQHGVSPIYDVSLVWSQASGLFQKLFWEPDKSDLTYPNKQTDPEVKPAAL